MATTIPLWHDAVVASFRDVTPTVREFCLRPGAELPAAAQHYEPGSHLQLQVLVNGKPHTRSYSLVGQPDASGYRIAVKRLEEGRGGSMAMWRLAVGDRLRITTPQNHFPLDLTAPGYLLVAGGIGITPLVLMAQTLHKRGANSRMLFGARSEAELAFFGPLRELLGDRLKTAVAERGEQVAFDEEIAALPIGALMFICGPLPMLDAARAAWARAGRPLADLRYETFGSSGRFAPQAFRVQLPRHQLDIKVEAHTSLLETLEAAGIKAMYGCRRGECGLCTMDVLALDGEIDHRDVFLSDHEKTANQRICVCVSRVLGTVTLESAYRPDA
jgi:vanillate O-demethylase ferredoxin subunit